MHRVPMSGVPNEQVRWGGVPRGHGPGLPFPGINLKLCLVHRNKKNGRAKRDITCYPTLSLSAKEWGIASLTDIHGYDAGRTRDTVIHVGGQHCFKVMLTVA